MTYEEALNILKRGGKVSHDGRIYELQRGIVDVTNQAEPKRVFVHDGEDAQPGFGEEARSASDWQEEAPDEEPAVVAPETVDVALVETQDPL